MKNLKSLLIATVLFLGANQVATAQAKAAHVNTSDLMTKYPAMLEAQKSLETLSKTYQSEFQTLRDEYTAKIKKYEGEAATIGDKINGERQNEVQDLEKRIQEYGQTAQKELQAKEGDLMKPIQEKIKLAIQKVGKAKGFQYIFDANGLLLAEGPDLTADVRKELGF